jgi:hypothetical protein
MRLIVLVWLVVAEISPGMCLLLVWTYAEA